ncbi:cupin domain-containing protein [Halobacillus trueperi]|uniref:Cupin domain-containing protein n=1 Tax=Halobacillus trueperi TaxID=156205 RepID=A0A3D8VQR0_9BACI|nr:cupin domain-containing protein [Halobacillus trueperi]RDY71128.1 cupin domain-containing protein [Halobacillus trueperi]
MDIYSFKKETGKKVEKFQSDFIMSRITKTQKDVHIGCMHLEEHGVIGYHQDVVPQLLLVVEGEGMVKGEEKRVTPVSSGDAVYWEKGEWHETKTEAGLTAIVIESEELDVSALSTISKPHSG